MNKIIICLLFITSFLSSNILSAQSTSGVQVYGGYVAGFNSDNEFTPSGIRGGYLLGADARVLAGDLYFLFGGRYNVIAINGASAFGFSSDNFDFGTARVGIGFTVWNINRTTRLRSKFLGSAHFVLDVDREKVQNPDYSRFNDTFAGLTTGIGLDKGLFTIDLEYELGLVNAVFEKPDTKIDFITLTGGIKF